MTHRPTKMVPPGTMVPFPDHLCYFVTVTKYSSEGGLVSHDEWGFGTSETASQVASSYTPPAFEGVTVVAVQELREVHEYLGEEKDYALPQAPSLVKLLRREPTYQVVETRFQRGAFDGSCYLAKERLSDATAFLEACVEEGRKTKVSWRKLYSDADETGCLWRIAKVSPVVRVVAGTVRILGEPSVVRELQRLKSSSVGMNHSSARPLKTAATA